MSNIPADVLRMIERAKQEEENRERRITEERERMLAQVKNSWSVLIEKVKKFVPENLEEYVRVANLDAAPTMPKNSRNFFFLAIPGLAPIVVNLEFSENLVAGSKSVRFIVMKECVSAKEKPDVVFEGCKYSRFFKSIDDAQKGRELYCFRDIHHALKAAMEVKQKIDAKSAENSCDSD